MAGSDAFLPPVVVEILGNDKDFLATIARDKAVLLDFAKTMTQAPLGTDSVQFQDGLLLAKTQLLQFAEEVSRAKLGVDADPLWAEINLLRAELAAMSPLDINVDVNTGLAMTKLALLQGELAMLKVESLTPAGGGTDSSSGGGFLANLFKGHITGSWMQALGVAPNIAAVLAPALPIILSTAAGLFSMAAGFVALGVAAGPTAFAIGSGVKNILAANDALALATPGTQAWSTAVTGLGTAWQSVPVPIQSAVQKILGLFSGQSAIGKQAGTWLVNLIDGMHLGSGSVSNMFMPLVVAMENALDKVFASLGTAMNSGKLSKFILSLAAMVGPAMSAFTSIAGSIIQIGAGLAKIGVGGQGLALLAKFFKLVATIASSGAFTSILSGFVTFDRAILTAVGYIVQIVNAILSFILNVPYIGPVLKVLTGGMLAVSAVMLIAKSAIGSFVVSMGTAVKAAVSGVGEILSSFGLWVTGMLGIGSTSVAMNIIVGATVVGLLLVLAAAVYELATHWSSVWGWIKDTFDSVVSWIASHLSFLTSVFGAVQSAWDAIFGGGPHNSTASRQASAAKATTTALQAQAAQMQAAASSATQYTAALNGVYPATGAVTSATQALIKAEEGIGPAIASQQTGFATFTQGAVQSYSQLMANIKQQNVTLSQEMAAAQQLIQKGMSPVAVEALAKTMPQDLIMMNQQSIPQIQALSQQYTNLSTTMGIVGSKAGFSLTSQMLQGLASANAGTRAWAQQELQILGINTLPVGQQIAQGLALGISSNAMNALLASTAIGKQVLQILTLNTLPQGQQIAQGLALGISRGTMEALLAVENLGNGVLEVMRHTVQSHSPSMAMATIGADMVAGLVQGLVGAQSPVTQAVTQLGTTMIALLTPFVARFTTVGEQLMQGLTAGIVAGTQAVVNAAVNAATSALAATQHATQTHSPSMVYAEEGRNWMLGLVQGIQGATGLVQGAMVGSLPRVGGASGAMGLGGGATIEVHATFQIMAPGGNAQQIKDVIQTGAAQAFAQQVLVSMNSGAGTVNG